MPAVRTILIGLGVLLLAAGIFWPWLSRIPLGRLPGDIIINRPGFKMYIPITTMIVVSLIISIVIRIFRR